MPDMELYDAKGRLIIRIEQEDATKLLLTPKQTTATDLRGVPYGSDHAGEPTHRPIKVDSSGNFYAREIPGDAIADLSDSLADDAEEEIQPAAGEEWEIKHIFHEDDIELYWYDGTNAIKFGEATGAGWYPCHDIYTTNSVYIKVKNVGGEAHRIGYSGRKTKG